MEQEFQVGSNGVIRFDVDPGDTSNGWSFDQDLPNNIQEALSEANVFTPVHDIDPNASLTEEIGYEVLGTFPNRVLVVSYFEVPMFSGSCNSLIATHMAVFYEFSNVIEIYIQDKPSCPTWNDGNAALGIQNNDGTVAYVPPGRNTSDSPWTTNNEAWSFSPVGPATYVFEWLDSTGAVIGNTPTINVCVVGSEIFTARITYTNTCNGETVVLTDDVLVTTDATFIVNLGPDIETCASDPIVLNGDVGVPGVTYQWFLNGIPIVGAINPTYTVNVPDSGTYSVEVSDSVCDVSDEVVIIFNTPPVIANPAIDLFICDDGVIPGIFDLTLNTPIVLGAQDPSLYDVAYHNSQADADAGINPIATPAGYPIVGVLEEIFVRIETVNEFNVFLENFGSGLGRVTHPYTNLEFNGTGMLNPNQYTVTNISTGLNAGWHIGMEDNTIGDIDGRMIFYDISDDINQIELY